LKNKSRYAFLFELSPTDYEGWAHGLKKAGYATDPTYAYKLISIIENYGLHSYDLVNGS
jgi:flagellum-specific peptidoglycan hydrolase FlgJ